MWVIISQHSATLGRNWSWRLLLSRRSSEGWLVLKWYLRAIITLRLMQCCFLQPHPKLHLESLSQWEINSSPLTRMDPVWYVGGGITFISWDEHEEQMHACTPCSHSHPFCCDSVDRLVKMFIFYKYKGASQILQQYFFLLYMLKPHIGGFCPPCLPGNLWRFSNSNWQVLVQEVEMPNNKLHFACLCMYEWNMNYFKFTAGRAGS